MTPDRCEPAPEDREQNTWHLLALGDAHRPALWLDHYRDGTGTVWSIGGTGAMGARFSYERGYRYVCPIRLPDGTIAKAAP